MSVLLLIIGLALFILLVVVHEFGHFLLARRGGVEVEEFGVGFPPKAMTITRKNGTEYTLNWLPLGGFVRLKGEHDSDTAKGSYGAAKLSTKVKIMLAGVGMNLITAYLMLVILALVGMPRLIDNQYTLAKDTKVVRNDVYVGDIVPGSPAEKAGLELRDKIVYLTAVEGSAVVEGCLQSTGLGVGEACGNKIASIDDLHKYGEQLAGKKVVVTIDRGGKLIEKDAALLAREEVEASKKTDNPKGYLGVSPVEYTLQRSTWSAPIVAGGLIKQFTTLTFKGLGSAIANLFNGHAKEAGDQVSGPVGIFVLLKDGSKLGYQFILMIIAIISLTLAIMNVLPIPALDGGRLFVTLLFRAIKKPLTKSKEEWIHGTGFALLMLLFIVITVVDVRRNF